MTLPTDPSGLLPAMAQSTETPLEPETPEVIVWDEPPEPLKQAPDTTETPLEPEDPEVIVWDEPPEPLEQNSSAIQ